MPQQEPHLLKDFNDLLILGHAAGHRLDTIMGAKEHQMRQRDLITFGLLTEDGHDVTKAGAELLAKAYESRRRARALGEHGAKAENIPGRTLPKA